MDETNSVVKLGSIYLNLLDMRLSNTPTDSTRGLLPPEIYSWVEDVDAIYLELSKRGVPFLAPPEDRPWGMRNITFYDPDGHRFEIAQPIRQEEQV